MPFERLDVTAFAGLADLRLELAPLVVLAGESGSGKTRLLRALGFLGDLARLDLGDALPRSGGVDALLPAEAGTGGEVALDLSGQFTPLSSAPAPDAFSVVLRREPQAAVRREEALRIKRHRGSGRRLALPTGRSTILPPPDGAPEAVHGSGAAPLSLSRTPGTAEASAFVEALEAIRLETAVGMWTDRDEVLASLTALRASDPPAYDELLDDLRWASPTLIDLVVETEGGKDGRGWLGAHERGRARPTAWPDLAGGFKRAVVALLAVRSARRVRLLLLDDLDLGLDAPVFDRLVEHLRVNASRTQVVAAVRSPAAMARFAPAERRLLRLDAQGRVRMRQARATGRAR